MPGRHTFPPKRACVPFVLGVFYLLGGGSMTLQEFFTANPKAAIAFSGGVDSAYLLYAAKKYGGSIRAYYVSSEFQPQF